VGRFLVFLGFVYPATFIARIPAPWDSHPSRRSRFFLGGLVESAPLFHCMTHVDITAEIKRRQIELYKRSLYLLVPFALELIAAAMHAPRLCAAAGFAAIVIGWAI